MQKRTTKAMTRTQKRILFTVCMLAIPLLQFSIFWVYGNFSSFLLAFQSFQPKEGALGYDISFAGFDNFKEAWRIMFSATGWEMIKNSLILYACNLIIVTVFALMFSYYIAKKRFMSGTFRVLLYLPHVVSSLVLAVLYRYLVTDVYMYVAEFFTGVKPQGGLFDNPDTQYGAVLFYNVWIGFGINVVLYTNAMSGINASLIEAAQMDGANILQEFVYIYFPMIYSTFVTFIVIGLGGLFTNQMNLLGFFGGTGKNYFNVFGFYLYDGARTAQYAKSELSLGQATLSTLSAVGLLITAIIAPVSLFTRKFLREHGPRVD